MTIYEVYFDSRARSRGTQAQPVFTLSNSLLNVTNVQVRSVSFANTLYNVGLPIRFSMKTTVFDVPQVTYEIPVGYYTGINLCEKINALVYADLLQTVVSFDEHKLSWTVPHSFSAGSLSDIVGLDPTMNYVGNFTSIMTSAYPSALVISSQQLQTKNMPVFCTTSPGGLNPLCIVPITEAFGSVVVYESQSDIKRRTINRCVDQIEFCLADAMTGRVVDELAQWNMVLLIECSD